MPRIEPTHEPPLADVYVRDRSWGADTLWSAFAATAARAGDRTAVVEDAARLSFGALATRAEALAGALAALGVAPGDAVALQLPNWWETVVALLATARLGAVAVPIPPFTASASSRSSCARRARASSSFPAAIATATTATS